MRWSLPLQQTQHKCIRHKWCVSHANHTPSIIKTTTYFLSFTRLPSTLSHTFLQVPRSPSKMRGRGRPNSQHGPAPHTRPAAAQSRKIFNCIVDDSALVAGVKRSTRNGIRQWVNSGQIRLFVPLHGMSEDLYTREESASLT
jgi:hypothetical protein